VLVLPQGLVFGWLAIERGFAKRMQQNAAFAATEAAGAIAEGSSPERDAALPIAARHRVRIRVFDESGALIADANDDTASDPSHRIGELFLGANEAPTLDEFDATLGPLLARPEIIAAREGGAPSGCRATPEATLLVCHAVRVVRDGASLAPAPASTGS